MKKMPCLFVREFHGRNSFTITPAITPGCEWVAAGEGVATIKRDGTACAVIGGKLYARYDAKRGKPAPANGIACDAPDPVTGHWPHWVPVGDEPQFVWHREAFRCTPPHNRPDGTYELCGPKVSANAEGLVVHTLVRHGSELANYAPRDFDGLRDFLRYSRHEGLVFHRADGRMCKIRRADFGYAWGSKRGAL